MLNRLAVIAAACLIACAPALAQDVRTLPLAAPLTGAEKMASVQGTGCASKTTPCAAVAVTPSLIATYLAPTVQPRDADLDAIAALSTVDFGRQLLTKADAASVRSTLGLGSAALVSTGTSGTAVPLLSAMNTWSSTQTIDGGNVVNVQSLVLQNLGPGVTGISLRSAAGGQLDLGGRSGNSWQIYSPNRAIQILVDNAAYDNAPQALLVSNANAAARTVLRLKQLTAGATGALLDAVDSTDTARFSVSATGAATATRFCYSATVCDYAGSGTPAGAIAAAIGSTYRRTDGGTGTTFYVKESGTDASGWVAK